MMAAVVSPAAGSLCSPADAPAAPDAMLAAQLQGLYQLHVQLETAIAFLEGREPHPVPYFESEGAPRLDVSSAVAPPACPEEARAEFAQLMAQIMDLQRDFERLKGDQALQEGGGASTAADSPLSHAAAAFQHFDGHFSASLSVISDEDAEGSDNAVRLLHDKASGSEPAPSPPAGSSVAVTLEAATSARSSLAITSQIHRIEVYDAESTGAASAAIDVQQQPVSPGAASSIAATEPASEAADDDIDALYSASQSPNPPDPAEEPPARPPSAATAAALATARLQAAQARRQVDAGVKEIARLQGLVRSLEAQVLEAAAPRAVLAAAAQLRDQLAAARREAEHARAEADALRHKSASNSAAAHDSHPVAVGAMAAAVAEAERLRKRVHVLETQLARVKPPPPTFSTPSSAAGQPADAAASCAAESALRRRLQAARAKLATATASAKAATAARDELKAQVDRLTQELSQSQAKEAALRERLRAEREEARRAAAGAVPPGALQKVLHELQELQTRNEDLERKLVAARQPINGAGGALGPRSAPASPSGSLGVYGAGIHQQPYMPSLYSDSAGALASGSTSTPVPASAAAAGGPSSAVAAELRILDLELERDQAIARKARLQARLDALVASLGAPAASKPATVTRKGTAAPTDREQELLDTVVLLRAALEKTRKGLVSGVSSAKYMAAVGKARAATARIAALESIAAESEQLRIKVTEAQREAADAHVVVSALRGQLREARRRAREAAIARDDDAAAQIAELERAVRERDAQIAVLQHKACDEARALLAEGLTPQMVVRELMATRAELAAAAEREAKLRAQLAPFDASFFSELSQLKREHEEMRLAQQEAAAAGGAAC